MKEHGGGGGAGGPAYATPPPATNATVAQTRISRPMVPILCRAYRGDMKLSADKARALLAAGRHGVLCTLHPVRGPDPLPVVYTVSGDYVGVPIDTVKPKSATRLAREANLAGDPRAALLTENWDPSDWSRLWWVRAHLRHLADPPPAVVDDLADQLSRTVPQYADKPFHRLIVCGIVTVTGWSA